MNADFFNSAAEFFNPTLNVEIKIKKIKEVRRISNEEVDAYLRARGKIK